MADMNISGYHIPAGTRLIANTYAVHRDSINFPDPDTFKPERFLNSAGKIDIKISGKLAAFSLGLRRCPGENVAKQELFILNASLLQAFNVQLDPETKGNPLIPKPGITLAPGDHKLIFTKR